MSKKVLKIKVTIIVGWWFQTWILFFHSLGNNHPNWRTQIFQRGRYTTNQIDYQIAIVSHDQSVSNLTHPHPSVVFFAWEVSRFRMAWRSAKARVHFARQGTSGRVQRPKGRAGTEGSGRLTKKRWGWYSESRKAGDFNGTVIGFSFHFMRL